MYIHSVSNIEQLKTTSQMRMLEHPDQAQRISDDMESAVDQVKQMAYVNKQDRAKLDYYASTSTDGIALKATEATVKQTQLMSAYTHYANWPDQLKAYQQALISGDEKTANDLQQGMLTSLKGLVQTGAITPEQAGSSIKTMHGVTEIAADHLAMYGNPNTTARDYHTVTSSPFNQNQTANANAPVNGTSQWLTNYYNQDKSFQGVEADIHAGNLPNPEAFDSLPAAQRQHAILSMQGVRVANGIINSGEPMPAIEKAYQELSSPGRVLSYQDKATRNVLGNYINDLKNGNYMSVIGRTPQGGAIMQNYVNRNAAIQNSPIDDTQKTALMAANKNDMVNAAVSYGESHHIPSEYIRPIPATDLAQMENGFKLNQDPAIVLQTMAQYNKANQAYIANSLKDPTQRLIAQTLSYAGNGVKPTDQLDFIAANQSGRNYDAIKYDASGLNDNKLRTRIASNLKDQLSLLGQQYNFMDGQTFQGSMIDSTLKYAKYLAAKNNDFSMSSWSKWVDQASAIYKNSYETQSNTNYMVNPKQLPQPMTSSELDMLAGYATAKGYESLQKGVTPAVFESMQSRNPLKMRISPTNNIEAVDQNGKVYFSEPFNSNLIQHAKADTARREDERKKAVAQAYENTVKMQLNVR